MDGWRNGWRNRREIAVHSRLPVIILYVAEMETILLDLILGIIYRAVFGMGVGHFW
jgi:hypothetical protein